MRTQKRLETFFALTFLYFSLVRRIKNQLINCVVAIYTYIAIGHEYSLFIGFNLIVTNVFKRFFHSPRLVYWHLLFFFLLFCSSSSSCLLFCVERPSCQSLSTYYFCFYRASSKKYFCSFSSFSCADVAATVTMLALCFVCHCH